MNDQVKPAGSPAPTGSADSSWPARDIVVKLVEAADLLLDHCNYDGHGWESIHEARARARDWLGAQDFVLIYDPATGDISIESPNAPRSATPEDHR